MSSTTDAQSGHLQQLVALSWAILLAEEGNTGSDLENRE